MPVSQRSMLAVLMRETLSNSRHLSIAIAACAALSVACYLVKAAAAASPSVPAPSTLSGTARLEGPVPKPARIVMAADQNCAKAHPAGATGEDVVVGAHGGLGNVIVYIASGLASQTYDPPATPATLEQKGCMYEPHVIAVQANQKLDILNEDGTLHNIHPMPRNNREWNKAQPPGTQPVEETFPREEIAIPVKCNVHPWMKSYIAVFKHPYFSVTSKDGSFAIPNLPPGNYTLVAWHEKFGTQTQQISVGPGSTDKVDFVFKSQGN